MINNNVSLSVVSASVSIPPISPQLPDAASNSARNRQFAQKTATENPEKREQAQSRTAVAISNLGGQSAIRAQEVTENRPQAPANEASKAEAQNIEPAAKSQTDGELKEGELSPEEKEQVARLKERDREVRAHEAAHKTAGGAYAGTPRLDYETGPDGRRYAVSGEVSIDTSPVQGDPKATIAKLRTVKKAALAPAQPSGQDQRVAAAAQAAIAQAQAELAAERNEPKEGESLTIDGSRGESEAFSQNNASPFPGQETNSINGSKADDSNSGIRGYRQRNVEPQLSLIA